MMADYAIGSLGVPTANVVIEDQSRTTVENIINSLPLVADGTGLREVPTAADLLDEPSRHLNRRMASYCKHFRNERAITSQSACDSW